MAGVGVHGAKVLQVDDLTQPCQNCGNGDGPDTGTVNVDTGIGCNFHILSHGPHILPELGLGEPAGKNTEQYQFR